MKIKKLIDKALYFMDSILLDEKDRYYVRERRKQEAIEKALKNREIIDIEWVFQHGSKVEKTDHLISIKPIKRQVVEIEEGSISVSHVVLRNDVGRDYTSNIVIIECETNLDIKDVFIYSLAYGYLHFKISSIAELGEESGMKKLRLYTTLQPYTVLNMQTGQPQIKTHLDSYHYICLDHMSYRDTLKVKFRVNGINCDKNG